MYTLQALSGGQTLKKAKQENALLQGLIKPSGLPIAITTRQDARSIAQVRIVPKAGFYVAEVIYKRPSTPTAVAPHLLAGIDLGVDNLVALTSNKVGFVPIVVNGRGLKSTNQYYNKRGVLYQ